MFLNHDSLIRDGSQYSETEFAPPQRVSLHQIHTEGYVFNIDDEFKEVLDNLPAMLLALNESRQIVYINRYASQALSQDPQSVLGYRPGEIFGCVHAWTSLSGCGTARACKSCGAVKAVLDTLATGKSLKRECRIAQSDGNTLNLALWTFPTELRAQNYVLVTAFDLSDSKRRRALERTFFHDILNTAGGVENLLQIISKTDKQQDQFDGLIDTAIGLSHSLIEQILSQKQLLDAEENSIKPHFEFIGSQALLNSVKTLYENHEVAIGKKIVIDHHSQDLTFSTDTALLNRVLGNMLKNALEASYTNDTVTLKCASDSCKIIFSVHNAGFMSEDTQNQVFQRSFSTKGPDRGLGTYSMQLLSKRFLSGDVMFESTRENGTTFYATFPLIEAEEEKQERPHQRIEQMNLLIVDDSEINLKIAEYLFQEGGCAVETESSAFKALERVKHRQYDMVLIDIHMPEMSGYELMEKIKAMKDYTKIPLIAISSDLPEEGKQGSSFHFDGYFRKPFEEDQIESFLDHWK